jgi:ribosomal protein L11 methyltransferase
MYLWRKSVRPGWFAANETALRKEAGNRLVVIERPDRKQGQLEAYFETPRRARELAAEFGGKIDKLPSNWLARSSQTQSGKPIKIGKRLVILRSVKRRDANSFRCSLVIPAGTAFGTGEHSTTAMSLRLLEEFSRKLKPGWSLIDLGTGSGILALAAKCFGAGRVVAVDNDARAIATARENARLNKIENIAFRVDDVRRRKFPQRIDIVAANLFSELLIEVAPKLRRARHVILSGILRNQERSVRRALHSQKVDIVEVRRRGKWIALYGKNSR